MADIKKEEGQVINQNAANKQDGGINLSILVTPNDMFIFLMRHIYTSFSGIVGLVFSILAFVLLIAGIANGDNVKTMLLAIGASLFTIIQPLQLWIKARQQVKLNPMFKEPLLYGFNQSGIIVKLSNTDEKLKMKWEEVVKVVETKQSIIIYMSTVSAYILPKVQYSQDVEQLKALIKSKIEPKKCKMKV